MKPEDRHSLIARSLFREANDAFFLFNPTSLAVVDLNPAALRLTGLEKPTALTLGLTDLFSTSSPGGIARLAQAMERTGFFHSREGYFLKRAADEPLPVNLSVSRIHLEPDTLGLVVARDVSDRKRSEAALRQVEARYNSLVELTGVVVWESDAEGRFLSIGPAFDELTGWSPADWIGRRFDELVHPEDRAEALQMHARNLAGQVLPRFEIRLLSRSDAVLFVEVLLVTRIRGSGQGQGGERYLGIARDTTAQKQVQQKLEQAAALERAKDAAERASRAKSEFLSNVSHELRTPLSAMLGFGELMAEHPHLREAPAEVRQAMEIIQGNGLTLLALIEDLLDIERIEAGQLRVERRPCVPAEIVASVLDSLRSRAGPKGLRLHSELAAGLARPVLADPLRLGQILRNLLDNAVKYTDAGAVTVSGTLLDPAGPGAEPVLKLEVHDTGSGMTEQEFAGLFQPFSRVRRAGPGEPGGTGLGLAICKRLAVRMGGDLTASSRGGGGATFTLTVPVAPVTAAGSSLPAVVPERRLPARWPTGLRILLAEDHEANRQVICTRLRQAGCDVVQARNGKEALEQVRDAADHGRPIAAVIMDMEMPILDGYEAVRQLRADGFDAPIVAVTAFAMDKDREECLRLGCDDHLSKPLDWGAFFGTLDRLLSGHQDHRV